MINEHLTDLYGFEQIKLKPNDNLEVVIEAPKSNPLEMFSDPVAISATMTAVGISAKSLIDYFKGKRADARGTSNAAIASLVQDENIDGFKIYIPVGGESYVVEYDEKSGQMKGNAVAVNFVTNLMERGLSFDEYEGADLVLTSSRIEVKSNPHGGKNCGCGQNPCITYGASTNPPKSKTAAKGTKVSIPYTQVVQLKGVLLSLAGPKVKKTS